MHFTLRSSRRLDDLCPRRFFALAESARGWTVIIVCVEAMVVHDGVAFAQGWVAIAEGVVQAVNALVLEKVVIRVVRV